MSRWNRALFGAVGLDLVLRVLLELLGGGSLAISEGVKLFGYYAFDLRGLVWAYGWLLIWLIVFQVTPSLFPQKSPDWTETVLNRTVFASGVVAIGVSVEGWIVRLTAETIGITISEQAVFVFPLRVPLFLAGIFISYQLVRQIGYTSLDQAATKLGIVYTPQSRNTTGQITGDRYLLAVLLLGTTLAMLVLLFPLPEIVLIIVQTANVVVFLGASVVYDDVNFDLTSDISKRMAGATVAIWGELEEVFNTIYILLPLIWFFGITATVVNAVEIKTIFNQQPVGLALLIVSLLGSGGHAILYPLRMSERARARADNSSVRLSSQSASLPEPPRVPLLLLPTGLLLATVALLTVGAGPTDVRNSIDVLNTTNVAVLTASVGLALAVVTVWNPVGWIHDLFRVPLSDDGAAALSSAVVLYAVQVGSFRRGIPDDIASFALESVFSVVIVLCPYFGTKLFLGMPGTDPFRRLMSGIKSAFGWFFISGTFVAILSAITSPVPSPIFQPVLVLFGCISAVSISNILIYLILSPFYFQPLSEKTGTKLFILLLLLFFIVPLYIEYGI